MRFPVLTPQSIARACIVLISAASAFADGSSPKPVSFVRDVAPILVRECQACHGPKTAESNYQLDTFEFLMRPGDFGTPPVTAGNPDESAVFTLITDADPHARMPNNGRRLTDQQITRIADWIREGAKFDGQDPRLPLREQIPRDIPHPSAPETYASPIPLTAVAFTPDVAQLLVGGYHELLLCDPTTGSRISRVGNIAERTFGLAFSPDGAWLAVAGGSPGVSGEVRLVAWSGGPKADTLPLVLAAPEDVVFKVAFRPDGKQLAAGGGDGSVRIFDVPSGVEKLKIAAHSNWVSDLCYSTDGKYFATASRDRTAKVFDAESGRLLATHSEHNVPVNAVAFAPDGKSVASAGGKGIRVWNAEDGKLLGEFNAFENDVYALLSTSETMLGAAADRTVRQFKLADRSLVRTLAPHPAWPVSLAWHAASHRACAGCFDGSAVIWDVEAGTVVKQFLAIPVVTEDKKK